MASARQMTSFKAAQDEILSSAPPYFTFTNPPSMGWWKAKFDLGLAAVAFVHHYQSILGTRWYTPDEAYWELGLTAYWQAIVGITPKQWDGVKADLGTSGAQLLTFKIATFSLRKGTWIRPTDQLLAVFGMNLNTYDVVAGLDRRIGWRLRKVWGRDAGRAAARPVSEEELEALALWASSGALARLVNAEYLGDLLDKYNGTASAA